MDTENRETIKGSVEEELNKNGWVVSPNVGTSMYPLLRQGKDLAVIRKRAVDENGIPERMKVDDIVLFKRDGALIMHRILKIEGDCYGICGDNRTCIEHGVRDEQIIGVVTSVIREGKELAVTDEEYQEYLQEMYSKRRKRVAKSYVKRIRRKLKKLRRK